MGFGSVDTENAVYSNKVHNILSTEVFPILFESNLEDIKVIDTSKTGGVSPYSNIDNKTFTSLMDQAFAADCIIKI